MAGGFVTAGNAVKFERDVVCIGVSNTEPQIKICDPASGDDDCTDSNSTFYVGTSGVFHEWGSGSSAPAHVLCQLFIPKGYILSVTNTNNMWVAYKEVGAYGSS